MAEDPAHDAVFDKIMDTVGDNGQFQKRFNLIFNVGLMILSTMVYNNMFLALSVPDHKCHIPGRELTNFTDEQWKNITIPRYFVYFLYSFCGNVSNNFTQNY